MTASTDNDMLVQAQPGHGIPSQDPDPAAQSLLQPQDAAREAQSVLVGGGLVAGAAAGAAIGVLVSGPVGIVVGSTVGAIAGPPRERPPARLTLPRSLPQRKALC